MADKLGKTYRPGEAVVRQGEPGDCMFLILEGTVEVFRREGGTDHKVADLGKGDIFGEMALIRHRERSATVKAASPLRVMTLDRKTFLTRVQEDPSIAMNILNMLVDRIEALDAKLAARESARHESRADDSQA